jgi:hypothetical protein
MNILYAQIDEEKYILKNIDKEFIGYYVSIELITTIEKTKNYNFARESTIKKYNWHDAYYAHIIVEENKMSCYPFYSDGYFEVSEDEYKEFHFQYIDTNEIIIDKNGHKYKKMSADFNNYDIIMNNYIGNIVLSDLIKSKKIIIENKYIYLPELKNKKFEIITWLSYYDEDINLVLRNYEFENEWTVYLKIINDELIIYYDPPIWYNNKRFHIIYKIKI